MQSQWIRWRRSFAIVLLSLSFLVDSWRLRRIDRRLDGVRKERAQALVYARAGTRVRVSALRLQGLIVKVGQFMSARTDILPLAFTRELTQLQDSAAAAPIDKVKRQLEEELGAPVSEVFRSFDEQAIASASLGQVHRATLDDGQCVAVKILRPGIERLCETDLAAIHGVLKLLHRFTRLGKRLRVLDVFTEFEAVVRQELDYRMEAEFLRRFRRQFATDTRISVPFVHDSYVTRRTLVMEFVDGAKITDVERFTQWGVLPATVVDLLLDAFLRQILDYGLVHVDPHPGNLMVLPDGRLAFLDFGMMSEIPQSDMRLFAKLVKHALARNWDGVVAAIDQLGFLQPHADRAFLKRAVAFMADRIGGLQLRRGPELDNFVTQFQNFLHDEPLVLQAKYMFLGRAIGMLSGLISTLQPEREFMTVLRERALPVLTRYAADGDGAAAAGWREPIRQMAATLFGDAGRAGTDIVIDRISRSLLALARTPEEIDRVLQRAERGDLTIRLELTEVMVQIERQQRLMFSVLWLGFMALSAALAVWTGGTSREQGLSPWLFGVAGAFLVLALWQGSRVRSRRHMHRASRR